MAQTIALFHSALGLRPSVLKFAESLREDGHTVVTPDLYEGRVFDELDAGAAHRDAVGIEELSRRAHRAVANLPERIVYAGFSMGSASAEMLAGSRPGAAGLIMMHGAIPPHHLGIERWPAVPVQIHYAVSDPWVGEDEVAALTDAVRAAGEPCDVHAYEEGGHLFADADVPDYSPASADLMRERVGQFLAGL
jgi:dienelactone hydrolase